MPELRRDPVTDRWVIIATERSARPHDFVTEPEPPRGGFCPFDEGHEDKTPPEIAAWRPTHTAPNTPGWKIRVVANKFPALRIEGNLEKRGMGLYDMMNGIGAHEVIIETPEHVSTITTLSPEHIEQVLRLFLDRLNDLKKDKRFEFGIIFKNVGRPAGASLEHTHSQLIATPIVPYTVMAEMDRAMEFYRFRDRCLFCDIVQQEMMTQKRVILDNEDFISFTPFGSRFPFESWILPKRHQSHFEKSSHAEICRLAVTLRQTLAKIEKALENPPYNYIVHTAPFNSQDLDHFHWHVEIMPRVTRVAGFEWGTGFYINPVPPENAAAFLREIDVSDPAKQGAAV